MRIMGIRIACVSVTGAYMTIYFHKFENAIQMTIIQFMKAYFIAQIAYMYESITNVMGQLLYLSSAHDMLSFT